MRRLRIATITAAAVVAVGGTAAAAVGFGGDGDGTPPRGALPPATAPVTRATLVDYEEVDGELAYGEVSPLRYNAPGLVTWLPAVGSTVERGRRLFTVDNEPVVLLYGALPLYRAIGPGVKGPDVKQLEENLRALGHRGFTVDETFTAATATAVKAWQKALGLTETGTVAPGQVRYAGGAIRVTDLTVRVGDEAAGEILGYTGTVRMVTVDLNVDDQRLAVVGGTVTVTLPDGQTVPGTVATVGAVASSSDSGAPEEQGGGTTTIDVVVTIADQAALGTLQQSPVEVRFVAAERRDVLTVPVAALVALAEGGYGVQVVEGSTARYVRVETGMFANGRVEVRSADLAAGTLVGIPK